MTVRITSRTEGKGTTIRVEGRLTAAEVLDLREECRSAGAPLRLDLAGLLLADDEGINELRSLSAKGAKLHGASPYIRHLLGKTVR